MASYLRARTPVDGWKRVVRKIMDAGMTRTDERGMRTKWLDNVMIHVLRPYDERVTDSYPFSEKVLREKYASQLLSPDRLDFEYTYGERLNAWGHEEINQIDYVVRKLKETVHTRRAVATTWDPRLDSNHDEVPCLNHFVFMERQGFVDLSVMVRSNDMYGAWLANIYAISELLRDVAERTDLAAGQVTTMSVNAHVYEHDWKRAAQL